MKGIKTRRFGTTEYVCFPHSLHQLKNFSLIKLGNKLKQLPILNTY